jgi:hypothetical protein
MEEYKFFTSPGLEIRPFGRLAVGNRYTACAVVSLTIIIIIIIIIYIYKNGTPFAGVCVQTIVSESRAPMALQFGHNVAGE